MFNRKTLLFAIVAVLCVGLLAGSWGAAPVSAQGTKTWIIHLNLRDHNDTTAIGVKDLDAYVDFYYSYYIPGQGWSPFYSATPYNVSSCNSGGYTFKKTPSAAVTTPDTATWINWVVATYRPSSQGSNCSVKYMQDQYREADFYTQSTIVNLLWNYFQQENW